MPNSTKVTPLTLADLFQRPDIKTARPWIATGDGQSAHERSTVRLFPSRLCIPCGTRFSTDHYSRCPTCDRAKLNNVIFPSRRAMRHAA